MVSTCCWSQGSMARAAECSICLSEGQRSHFFCILPCRFMPSFQVQVGVGFPSHPDPPTNSSPESYCSLSYSSCHAVCDASLKMLSVLTCHRWCVLLLLCRHLLLRRGPACDHSAP